MIDPTARIEPGAAIGQNASIGPYCVVGPHAVIGDGCRLVAHVHVAGHTTIGPRTVLYPFASLGSPPQSVKYRGGPTRLVVGADCDIREGVTMNTGTEDGGGVTEVGDRCFLMVGSHVGHDCMVGNDVTFANNVVLGGHVTIGDFVVFGGQAAVRQFVRIGEGAMIVGLSGVRADVIPFGLVQGPLANLMGLNVVGMRRRGFTQVRLISSNRVGSLAAAGATNLSIMWRTTNSLYGYHTLRAVVSPVGGETNSLDNTNLVTVIVADGWTTNVFIAKGSAWRYQDQGLDLTQTPWALPSYYDSVWSQGAGPLGYSENGSLTNIATSLSWGPTPTNKHPAYYLRQQSGADVLLLH